jgi:1-acyl-sn-glycerol-3-phosphate acyltransferase
LVGLTLALLPPYLLALGLGRRPRRAVARAWFAGACSLCSLRLRARGRPAAGPALFVANHVSYLDVPVLGALIDAVFVAKAEVAGWPAIGWLARLHGTLFIARARRQTPGQTAAIARRLDEGESVLVFPEGTSSDGRRVLPFKSALFAVAERRPVGAEFSVQPISIAYVGDGGGPLGAGARALYAWYGDMTLLDHLFTVLGLPGVAVEVVFHDPVPASGFASRKDLARRCETLVADGVRATRRHGL